jgi:hypothetical protein
MNAKLFASAPLAAILSLLALNFASAPASASTYTMSIDENGGCNFAGISCTPAIDQYGGCSVAGVPCSLYTTDPTGKVSGNVWIFTFPTLVASTDINIYEPGYAGITPYPISDHLRSISPHDTAHGLLAGYTADSNTACIQSQINAGTKQACANRVIYYSLDDLGGQPTPTFTTLASTIEDANGSWTFTGNVILFNGVSDVPVPAALPLFASGLVGLGLLGWRRKKAAAG